MPVTSILLEHRVGFGDKFIIRYRASSNPQFAINLIDNSRNNILLHFNPRYERDAKNNKKLILNNCINGKWQEEVKYDLMADLRGEKDMTIVAQPHAFVITAADGKIYEFPMRISAETCSRVEITMGSFKSVVHEKQEVNYHHAKTYEYD